MTTPRIMIVDDERLNINVLNEILKEHYLIKVAMNGEQALQRAVSEPRPDMILLDIQMPDRDGYAVCEALKANPESADIPIIFITALAEEADERRGLELGAVDYITKPLRPSIILARVETHLRLKHAQAVLAEKNLELEQMLNLRESMDRITRHDLKSPLNGILGVADMLLEEANLTDEQKEWVKLQERAGFKMLEMINRSLDMLKMEQGTYRLDAKAVDVARVVERIVKELQLPAVEISVDGVSIAHAPSFLLQGEELLFYSMLANLIKNALEAQAVGEIISITMVSEPVPQITIQNPAVVPVEIQSRFFEKYATSGKEEGTGLGTYSAKLIAETLGGEIAMLSTEVEGTQVTASFAAQSDG
uniref:histidine kinase n=1 Tax=Magnetococcus massalia (strain MO-1) TaxID=451514 RepID=A0A1S7LKJ0_MAGMO|nr:Putative two-component hybrid sensor and regulator [Candidatus Magnetococcus massalia]